MKYSRIIISSLIFATIVLVYGLPLAASLFEKHLADAKRGDVEAQYIVGTAHEYGNSVSQDFAKAAEWYARSANAKYAPAQAALGYLYQTASGVKQDSKSAVDLYRRAAEAGNARGQFLLALAYVNGVGVAKSGPSAAKWFHEAAKSGHQQSQLMLATMLHAGVGIKKNIFAARRWFDKASKGPDSKIAEKAKTVRKQIDNRVNYDGFSPQSMMAIAVVGLGLLALVGKTDSPNNKYDPYKRDAEFHARCAYYWNRRLGGYGSPIPPWGC